MGRSGYSEDLDNWDLIRWRGQIASAIRGKRGQTFLRDLVSALDAMPEKRLITHDIVKDGEVCALGSLGRYKGLELEKLDPEDHEQLGAAFDISSKLAQEIEYINDETGWGDDAPEKRWQSVRKWAASHIRIGG